MFSTHFSKSILTATLVLSGQTVMAGTTPLDGLAGQSVLTASKARKNGFTPLSMKKGGSGVSLAYRLEGTPVAGSPLTIRVMVSSNSEASVTLRAGEGLTLASPDQVLNCRSGQSAEYALTVVPKSDGHFYLNLFSTADGRTSASSIALQVGKTTMQMKPSGQVQVTPSGERLISVPAQ